MSCVVCGGEVRAAQYANAWETARKLYPCCSAACAGKFDPDVHWLPAKAPPPLSGPDEAKLLHSARERIRAGDKPSLIVRDMLISGVGLLGVRKLLIEGELSAKADDRVATRITMFGWISALFGGGLTLAERRSQQDPAQLRAAQADLDVWRARFE